MWAAETTFDILGTRLVVQSHTWELADAVDRLLAPFSVGRRVPVRAEWRFSLVEGSSWRPEPYEGQTLAFRDCRRLGSGGSPVRAVSHLLASINRAVVDAYPGFAVHAGVVASNGGAIAIPAESGGGKTTLTAACLRSGLGYLSDEALCVDPENGWIVPYPKPLGLSVWSRSAVGVEDSALMWPASGEALVPPDSLGGKVVEEPLPLSHVVLAEFGHDGPVLEEASGHEAMAALLRLSFNHYRLGETAFRTAARLVDGARVWRLRYGDPIDAAEALRRLA